MIRDSSSQLCANLLFGHRGPVLHCLSVDHMNRIGDTAESVSVRGNIVSDNPVTALPNAFILGFFNDCAGLGGEANDQGGAAVTRLAETCQNVWIFHEIKMGQPVVLFDFFGPGMQKNL